MPSTVFDKKPKYEKLIALIRGTAYAQNKTYEDLAEIIGCHSNTVVRRMKMPETYTLGELAKIGSSLNIPLEELRQAITY